jgi:hypothetical protein
MDGFSALNGRTERPFLAHLGPVGRHSAGPLSGAQRLCSRPPSALRASAFEHRADLVFGRAGTA